MTTFAIICGVLGVIGYFFYFIVGSSGKGSDGQGVNITQVQEYPNAQPSATDQKGRWD